MFIPLHQHLLVKGTIKKATNSTRVINKWFRNLVNKVGMVVVAGPTSVFIDELGNEGLTGTVTLATSHASIHIWDEKNPKFFQFDIYSCKQYDVQTVIDHLNEEFDMIEFEFMEIDRNDDLRVTRTGKGEGNRITSQIINGVEENLIDEIINKIEDNY